MGMSANVPTDICFSFSGLVKRGGETGPHKDGWGIAFYEGKKKIAKEKQRTKKKKKKGRKRKKKIKKKTKKKKKQEKTKTKI
jgi:predicted glutamine amidotransferase